MLRAMLGIGGVALITLGVFGRPVLDNAHQAVNDFFAPDTVVASVEQSVPEPRVIQPAQSVAAGQPALASSGDIAKSSELLEAPGNLTEVQAAAKKEPVLLKTATSTVEPAVAVAGKDDEVEQIVKTTAGSVPDSTLYVMKERVNLRQGPSINHPVVLQLDIGQELMEFKRDGKWIHVGAYGTSGKIGWVHTTLVGRN